jgi:hypothetical protein
MDSNRRISLYGFRDTDQTVFCSLLSLLSFKTDAVWEVVEDESSDVTVVDVDSHQGLSLAETMESNGRKVIRFGQYSSMDSKRLCLNKPLRAADILKCLNSFNPVENTSAVAEPDVHETPQQEVVVGYRLRRWPCPKILSGYPGSSRLCALLLKDPLSIEQAAERSGMAADLVWDFVSACKQQNFVVEQEVTQALAETAETKPANAGLFAMLRSRFGSR